MKAVWWPPRYSKSLLKDIAFPSANVAEVSLFNAVHSKLGKKAVHPQC